MYGFFFFYFDQQMAMHKKMVRMIKKVKMSEIINAIIKSGVVSTLSSGAD